MSRRIISLLLAALMLFSLFGCDKDNGERVWCDIAITLPEEYEEYEASDTFDLAFRNERRVVGITRISFDAGINSGIAPTHTAYRFAEEYRDASGYDSAEIIERGDVPYFSYTLENALGNEYFYMPTFYRTHYAYVIIMFICPLDEAEEQKEIFLGYTESVRIVE